jgi:hypothetical protein
MRPRKRWRVLAYGKDCPGVKKFLNRLLGMPVMMQSTLFSHFMSILEEKVSKQPRST